MAGAFALAIFYATAVSFSVTLTLTLPVNRSCMRAFFRFSKDPSFVSYSWILPVIAPIVLARISHRR